jgi:hypothetical protein
LAIALASQRNNFPDPVRHFGISVLESEIKYFWISFHEDETVAIRHGLLQLCGEVPSPRHDLGLIIVGWEYYSTDISHSQTRTPFRRDIETHMAEFLGRSITYSY